MAGDHVSPMRYADCPRNWPEISKSIREDRAGGRCECSGQCGSGHEGRCEARHGQPHPVTGSRVVLTTAHRDHEPRNCAAENLFAACQRCHLWYDRDQHAATRAWTRAGRPDVQLEFFLEIRHGVTDSGLAAGAVA